MATIVSGDGKKPSREEDSSSNSVSTAVVPVAPPHFTLKNIASQIDLLDILIVAGVGYALKTGKLLNWIRKPWLLLKGWIDSGYTGPEDEFDSDSSDSSSDDESGSGLKSGFSIGFEWTWRNHVKLAQTNHSRWSLGSHIYSGTPDLKGFKGIGETYIAETYAGFRQRSFK